MAAHNDLGKWGEEMAVGYLRSQGYTIRERNWRFGHRDIDIVALTADSTTLVFVEVKTRTSVAVADPTEAVDLQKIRSIGLAAHAYVKKYECEEELRFDVLSVVGQEGKEIQIEHIEDAFNPLLL